MYVSNQEFEFSLLILAIIALHLLSKWFVEKLILRKIEDKPDPRLELLKEDFGKITDVTYFLKKTGVIVYLDTPLRFLVFGRSFISWGGRGTVHRESDSVLALAAVNEDSKARRLIESTWIFKRYREFPESGITLYYIRWKVLFVWRLYFSGNSKSRPPVDSGESDSTE